jgi:uncharacterized paraquat-inducible protein A
MQQTLPCPNCNTAIPFNVYLLLQGHKFECPNCHCTVSMPSSSKPPVEKAIEQYDKLMKQEK